MSSVADVPTEKVVFKKIVETKSAIKTPVSEAVEKKVAQADVSTPAFQLKSALKSTASASSSKKVSLAAETHGTPKQPVTVCCTPVFFIISQVFK